MRQRTHDDATTQDAVRMRFYVTEKLGPKQSITPEGFLLCEDVPLARTGEMAYAEGELDDLKGDASGVIYVTRDEKAVFDPIYIASLNGKPAVNDHPDQDVNPENWRELAIGVVMNVHRGTGVQADLLLGDLLITDAQAIEDIQSGKREVSAGYTADYDEIAPGKARQYNLIGNHVALVESGRCGPRCSIGDRKTVHHTKTGDCSMTTKTKRLGWLDRIADALKGKKVEDAIKAIDEAKEELEAEPEPEERTQDVHIYSDSRTMRDEDIEERFKKVEDAIGGFGSALGAINEKLGISSTQDADPDEEDDKDKEKTADAVEEESNGGEKKEMRFAKDSSFLSDSFQDANAGAEILVPGIQLKSYDKAMAPRQTVGVINETRKNALALSLVTSDGKALLEELNGGKPINLETMDCASQRALFRSAVSTRKARNNAGATRDVIITSGGGLGVTGPVKTPADLNKRNREHFARIA